MVPTNDDGGERTLGEVLAATFSPEQLQQYEMPPRVQGIAPPLETGIAWLSLHFSSPDNFLYIVLKKKEL